MSKKLLSEAQVRRFQSLACIQPIHEMESYAPTSEEVAGEEMELAPIEAEAPAEEAEEADVSLDQELVQDLAVAADTVQQVADALNSGSEEEAGEEMELAPVEDGVEAAPEEEEVEMEAAPEDEEEEMELQEALDGVEYVPTQEEIVKTVAKRVAARLQEAKTAQARLDKALGNK